MKAIFNHYGQEFLHDPSLNFVHRIYIRIFGVPISGLRIRLRRVLPSIKGNFGSIIDLGCGKGIFSFELARRFPKATVVGIDIDPQLIESNLKIVEAVKIKNLRFERDDILNLKYSELFDLAVSVDNLEHIEDDISALISIKRALKPGGLLVCHVPARERIWLFKRMATNFNVVGHVRPGYTKKELKEKFGQAGFELVQLGYTYGYLETISNNLSYLITRAEQKNVLAYALLFPFLNFIAWIGRNQNPKEKGAGLLALGRKPNVP